MKNLRLWVKVAIGLLILAVVVGIGYLVLGFIVLKPYLVPKELDVPDSMQSYLHFGMTFSELEDNLPEDFHLIMPNDLPATGEFDVKLTRFQPTEYWYYSGMNVRSDSTLHFVQPCSYNGVQSEPMLQSISGIIDTDLSLPLGGDYKTIVNHRWGVPAEESDSVIKWRPTGKGIQQYDTEVQVLAALLSGQYVPEGCTATADMTALEEYGDFSLDKTALQAVRAADNYADMKSGYVRLEGATITVIAGYDMYAELAQRCLDAGK